MLIKKSIKKLIFISALAINGLAYATLYTVPTCQKQNVTTPCDERYWDIGGDAIYYSSGAFSHYYDNISNTSVSWSKTNADYSWGYRLDMGYHFSTGNALQLDWYHYRSTTPNVNDSSGSIPFFVKVTSKFDIVNLAFEQTIKMGERIDFGLIEGVQYANLIEDFRDQNTEEDFVGHSYAAAGIRLGLNGSLYLQERLSLFAKGALSILYGRYVYLTTTDNPGTTSFERSSSRVFYREGDTSIGIRYKKIFPSGQFDSTVAWDNIYYGLETGQTGFTWTGLRLGMRFLA